MRDTGRRFFSAAVYFCCLFGVLACGPSKVTPIFAVDASAVQSLDGSMNDHPVDGDRPDALTDGPVVDQQGPELPPNFVCPTTLVGFGILNGGTTGGGSVDPIRITTLAELTLYAGDDSPRVIEIADLFPVSDQIRVKSNKTIRGTAPGAGLVGGGLNLTDVQNVIIQRLSISQAVKVDAISINNSKNIWIDHCSLSSERSVPVDTYDGLIDITHASDWVTVSWTKFSDHDRASLVGHSASPTAALEDNGHLTVTYHHNWFINVNSNMPRARFGTIHVFNNLYQNLNSGNAIASQMGAEVVVEGSVFQQVVFPITTVYQDPMEGFARETNNLYDGSPTTTLNQITPTMVATWNPSMVYDYRSALTDTRMVQAVVETCAGAK